MSLHKSTLTVNGENVRLSMPFTKVDKANRLVSGYATLDNIDTQGDVVLAEASVKAFARARGNIREMHQPIAVGKMVDFREDEFFDTETKKFYRGIFVTARVSKGAESTWEKVLDETLTGFSIGGEIKEASHEFVKDANGGAGGNVRFIKDYDLTELSLVDNPANQLANVLSIQKSADGDVMVKMGEVAATVVENVFVCTNDDTVVVKATDAETCPMCGTKMENAGWFETGPDRAEKVQEIVTKFRAPKEAAPISDSEGGVDVKKSQESNEETASEVSSPNPAEAQAAGDENAVATVEEEAENVDETEGTEEEAVASPEEVSDDETEISKKIDELHNAIRSSLDESKTETLAKVASLEEILNATREEFMNKASELESKIEGYGEQIKTQKNKLADLEATLNKVNSSDAIRKSADVVRTAEPTVQKENFWGNAFSD